MLCGFCFFAAAALASGPVSAAGAASPSVPWGLSGPAIPSGPRAAFESPCPGSDGPCITVSDGTTGAVLKRLPATSLDGRVHARAAELHAVPERRSIVAAFAGLPELWEISLDPAAPPVFDGLVHDHRMGEGIGRPGYLAPRRTQLARPLVALAIDAASGWVIARERAAEAGPGETAPPQVVLLHLDIRRAVARWPAAPGVDTAAATPAVREGRRGFAVPAEGRTLWFEPPR
ncbi:MAG: hypothetical protein JNL85_12270 [Rubrivivax sp.]|nr:hypothetical protein [Rubrivivax sp.]